MMYYDFAYSLAHVQYLAYLVVNDTRERLTTIHTQTKRNT